MLTHASDSFRFAIHELQDAADGRPSGMPFSALTEIALLRVILAEGLPPDCRTHLLKAVAWLASEQARSLAAPLPTAA